MNTPQTEEITAGQVHDMYMNTIRALQQELADCRAGMASGPRELFPQGGKRRRQHRKSKKSRKSRKTHRRTKHRR